MFNHSPPKQHRFQFRFGWSPLCDNVSRSLLCNIRVLDEYAATDRTNIDRGSCTGCRQSNQTQVLFLLQDAARFGLKIWRNDDLAEDLADHFRQRFGQRTVAYDNSAKGRLFIRGKRLIPSLAKIDVRANTTGVGMLQYRDGRLFEFGDQICRRADVENVIKGKFLAVEFFEVIVEIAVERRGLMRIFSVTQSHHQRKRK